MVALSSREILAPVVHVNSYDARIRSRGRCIAGRHHPSRAATGFAGGSDRFRRLLVLEAGCAVPQRLHLGTDARRSLCSAAPTLAQTATPAAGNAADHGFVIIVIAVLVTFVSRHLLQESLKAQTLIQKSVQTDDWRSIIETHRWMGPVWNWSDQQLDLSEMAQQLATAIARSLAPAVARSVGVISQAGAGLLAFFFFLRDQEVALAAIRRMLPLAASETDLLFNRISTAVESAIYGRLFIGFLQGLLGGVIFALVGLPAPVFLAAVMSLLSTLPAFGGFMVWVPAGAFLLADGHWVRALIVLVWGVAVIHPVDNLLYPVLVGARLGLHPLVLFVAFVGGLIAFGPSGLILGPCIIAFAAGIADVLKSRSLAFHAVGGSTKQESLNAQR